MIELNSQYFFYNFKILRISCKRKLSNCCCQLIPSKYMHIFAMHGFIFKNYTGCWCWYVIFSSLSRVHAYLILHLLVLGRTSQKFRTSDWQNMGKTNVYFLNPLFLNHLNIPNFKLSKSSKFSNFESVFKQVAEIEARNFWVDVRTNPSTGFLYNRINSCPPHLKTLVYCTKTYNVPSQPNLVKKIISKNFFSKMAVLVSIGIIAASLFLCDQIRNNIVTKWNPGLVQNLVLDAILAFELCGPALEFGVIFNHYGIGVWTIGKRYASKS